MLRVHAELRTMQIVCALEAVANVDSFVNIRGLSTFWVYGTRWIPRATHPPTRGGVPPNYFSKTSSFGIFGNHRSAGFGCVSHVHCVRMKASNFIDILHVWCICGVYGVYICNITADLCHTTQGVVSKWFRNLVSKPEAGS